MGTADRSGLVGPSEKTLRLVRSLDTPACAVLGVSAPTGLSILRSLAREGIAAIGLDTSRSSLGAVSNCLAALEIYRSEEELLHLLLRIGEESRHRPSVLCESDGATLFLHRHRGDLEGLFSFVIPERPAPPELIHKKTMMELAAAAGLTSPRTLAGPTRPPETLLDEAPYPCVIKPVHTLPDPRLKAQVAQDRAELEKILRGTSYPEGCVVQELIPLEGSAIWTCLGYCSRRGEPLVMVTGRKLRQRPPGFGLGTFIDSRHNGQVKELSRRLLRHIDFRGCFEIEFIRTGSGEYYFVEINVRPCALNSLAVAAEADIPVIAHRDACGQAPEGGGEQKEGVLWMHLLPDLDIFLRFYRRDTGVSLWDWAKTARRCSARAVLDHRDLKPFLLESARYLAKTLLIALGLREPPRGRQGGRTAAQE